MISRDLDIEAFATDPDEPQRLYAAAGDQGLFQSEDGGAVWRQTLAASVHAVLAVPGSYGGAICGASADAMFHSSDGGRSWRPAAVPIAFTGAPGRPVSCIACDPDEPRVAYALAEGGVLTSRDGGAEWNDLVVRGLPRTTYTLAPRAAGGGLLAGTEAGVFASRDGGFYWTPVAPGLDGPHVFAVSDTAAGILAAAHPAAQTSWDEAVPGRVYRLARGAVRWWPASERLDGAVRCFAEGSEGIFAGTTGGTVVRSRDGGATWQVIAKGLPPVRALALASPGP